MEVLSHCCLSVNTVKKRFGKISRSYLSLPYSVATFMSQPISSEAWKFNGWPDDILFWHDFRTVGFPAVLQQLQWIVTDLTGQIYAIPLYLLFVFCKDLTMDWSNQKPVAKIYASENKLCFDWWFIALPFTESWLIPLTYKKVKAVPLPAWSGPEGSRNLNFPDFMTTAQDGGKVVSLKHRPPLPPGNVPGTHFC
jgi:hypothetical protein